MDSRVPPGAKQPTAKQPTVEQLAEWFLERMRRGERPSISEYANRYPERADEIREAFSALAFVERFAPQPAELAAPLAPAKRLGDFRIVREVGRGGMGVVYEAVQESLGRRVALKVMSAREGGSASASERFHREARVAARLHHTNLVPVFDVGEHDGVLYYAMQFIRGSSLDKVLVELRRFERSNADAGEGNGASLSREIADSLWSARARSSSTHAPAPTDGSAVAAASEPDASANEDAATSAVSSLLTSEGGLPARAENFQRHYYRSVARVGLQVAEGLAYLHAQGLLHRDIKPSNLLLDTSGVVWITDLGLVRDDEAEALTRTGDIVGTLRYMGPERLSGQTFPSSDVYSLGMTLYELLTLRPAFAPRGRGELAHQITSVDPPRPSRLAPNLPLDLETIVLKAIDKDPRQRYASAAELGDDLRRFLEDRPITARRAGALERSWRWCRRNRATAALLGSLAALLIVLAAGSSVAALLFRDQARDLRGERATSTRRLYDALVAQAQASRWSRRPGQRWQSLQALTEAAHLIPQLALGDEERLKLRNEAIACMALLDARPPEATRQTPRGAKVLAFDGDLERCVWSDANGNLSVRRIADDFELARLQGAGSWGHVAQFSPSGRYLVVKYHDPGPHVVKAWDLQSGDRLFELAGGESFDFRPQDDVLAVGLQDGAIYVLELPARPSAPRFSVAANPTSLRYHPSEERIAVASNSEKLVHIFDAESGRVVAMFPHPQGVFDLAWGPDGRRLACACGDFRTYVWDVAARKQASILTGHQAEVTHVAFSHSGDLLATYAWDGTTRLWDAWTGQERLRLPGLFRQFDRDDRRLAITGGEATTGLDTFGLWEIVAADGLRTLHDAAADGKGPTHIDVSSDGRLLASTAPDGVRLWELQRGAELARFCGEGETSEMQSAALFAADGGSVLTSSKSGLRYWPLERLADESGQKLRLGPPSSLVELAPTRRMAQSQARVVASGPGPYAQVVDLDQRKVLAQLGPHAELSRLAISPDARWVATGTWHGVGAKVWDAATGRELHDLWPAARSATVVFSPDGRWLVVGADESYRFFETQTWSRSHDVKGSTPHLAAFGAEGRLLAGLYSRHSVQLIDPATGRGYAQLEAPSPEPAAWLSFAPDGGQLVVACLSHKIQVWDLRRIRQQLAVMDLDWDLPPLAAPLPVRAAPVRVEVVDP